MTINMHPVSSEVFFYGLFMDTAVLEAKGIRAVGARRGVVHNWTLRIGQRASLVHDPGRAVHGIVMPLPLSDLERLYAEESVQMYRPVAVLVDTDGASVAALAYVLPTPPAPEERNPEYALRLRVLAERLGLPSEYTRSIG